MKKEEKCSFLTTIEATTILILSNLIGDVFPKFFQETSLLTGLEIWEITIAILLGMMALIIFLVICTIINDMEE